MSYYNQSLTANNATFNLDYQDGKYGWNESSERGADTFHPFSSELKSLLTLKQSLATCSKQHVIDDSYTAPENEHVILVGFAYNATTQGHDVTLKNVSLENADIEYESNMFSQTINAGIYFFKIIKAYVKNGYTINLNISTSTKATYWNVGYILLKVGI